MARKRSQPLYPYLLPWNELPRDLLGRLFNIHSDEEWANVDYIVVNEDGLKFPVMRGEEAMGASMSHRVIQNPAKVKDLDELYDAFEVNKGTNVKYVIMSNPQTHTTTSGMTLQ